MGTPGAAASNMTMDAAFKAATEGVSTAGDGRAPASEALPDQGGELDRLAAAGKVHVFLINTSPTVDDMRSAAKAELDLYNK